MQGLIGAGHEVLCLSRSDASARKLTDAGAAVLHGDLENPASLRTGASAADGEIHAWIIHDFTRFAEVCAVDKTAIRQRAGYWLAQSVRRFIVTAMKPVQYGKAHGSTMLKTTGFGAR